jgi:hypothetical protein
MGRMNVHVMLSVALLWSGALFAQVPIGSLRPDGERHLLPSTAAILDLREAKLSLPCSVKPVRPQLGFDLGFHTGYKVGIRLRDLAREGDVLTVVFRVIPNNNPNAVAYFQQKWNVPAIPENAEGEADLEGAFRVGAGDYRVDWLMRDGSERVCSAYWRFSVRLPEGPGPVALAPGSIVPLATDADVSKHGVKASTDSQLKLTILVHIASQDKGAAALAAEERQTLLSILQSIDRDPRIGSFSVVAFSLDYSKAIFEQDATPRIDLTALDGAISSLKLGTVSLDRLAAEHTGAEFLVQLVAEQLSRNQADGLIFVGTGLSEEEDLSREMLLRLGEAGCPVFYLSYDPHWSRDAGADLISSAVKHMGGYQFTIRKPVDFMSAWSRIVSRLQQERESQHGASHR